MNRKLSPELFKNPPRYFRPLQIIHGMDRMAALEDSRPPDEDEFVEIESGESADSYPGIDRFLETLARLGTGGIVTNAGANNYLVDPHQWQILRYGIQKAVDLGLHIWLYDEKGYPSGTAGGYVTRAQPRVCCAGVSLLYPGRQSGRGNLYSPTGQLPKVRLGWSSQEPGSGCQGGELIHGFDFMCCAVHPPRFMSQAARGG